MWWISAKDKLTQSTDTVMPLENAPVWWILWWVGEDAVLEGFSEDIKNWLEVVEQLTEEDLKNLIDDYSTAEFPAYGSLTSNWSYAVITSRRWTDVIWIDKESIVPKNEIIGQISKEDAESYHHWNYTRDQLIGLCRTWAEGFKSRPRSRF